ncbi:MAG: HD domain-containing protein [Bacteroidia bacterium]|nr:HD domain-containing protein [Bacteroidia bacterium]MBP9689279.1 HD domain-containing protein [Bacteroidia bacterium]
MKVELKHPIFKKIAQVTNNNNIPAYVVGGFVRDIFLERPSKDIDVVVLGDGIEQAKQLSANIPKSSFSYFKNYGTAMVKTHDWEIEFVGARKESYSENSRKPTVEPGTLADDQNRRDFTINALAISLNNNDYGTLVDPFNGISDLENKIIRTPLNPDITFSDDPLRMMRGIRFATQLRFEIEHETFDSIKRNAQRIKIISFERISDELNKIMLSQKPSIGFNLLFDSGLLQIIFPEMAALYGVDIIDGKAHKDNFYHTLMVLDNICLDTDDLWLRWAALLHDIAKPVTKRFEKGNGWTFHGHEDKGSRMVKKIFSNLKLPLNEKMKFVEKIVALHHRPKVLAEDGITDSAIRRLIVDADDDIDALFLLCKADITSKNRVKVETYRQKLLEVKQLVADVTERDALRNWQPPITGEYIMQTFGIGPGREVGLIKSEIREAILEGKIANNLQEAHVFMVNIANRLGLKPIK